MQVVGSRSISLLCFSNCTDLLIWFSMRLDTGSWALLTMIRTINMYRLQLLDFPCPASHHLTRMLIFSNAATLMQRSCTHLEFDSLVTSRTVFTAHTKPRPGNEVNEKHTRRMCALHNNKISQRVKFQAYTQRHWFFIAPGPSWMMQNIPNRPNGSGTSSYWEVQTLHPCKSRIFTSYMGIVETTRPAGCIIWIPCWSDDPVHTILLYAVACSQRL